MRSTLREWSMRAVLVAVSSLLALLAAEATVRVFLPISDGRDNVTIEGVPIRSWFEPRSVYRQVSNEYDAITSITDKGHRVPGVDGNPEVIFLGDSFTYGWGIPDDETFVSLYCTQMGRACANLGVPGTGTAKQLNRLEDFLATYQWRPREVKLFFFGMSGSWSAGNDFVDNYDERGLTAAPSGHEAAADAPAAHAEPRGGAGLAERVIGLQTFLLSRSNLMRLVKYYWGPMMKSLVVADPGPERMADALQYTSRNLTRLDALSRRMGFSYTIYLLVPVQDIIRGTYPQTLDALNRVSPKPVVPTAQLFLQSPQQFYYAYDGHINAVGSRRIAEYLVSLDSGRQANPE